jgi:hypothetical protein
MFIAVSSLMIPAVVTLALQETTSAAMDRTLAMGANVAAMRGIAVEANHQLLLILLAFQLLKWCEGLTKDHYRPHLQDVGGPSDVNTCAGAQVCPVKLLPYSVVHLHGFAFQKGFHRVRC